MKLRKIQAVAFAAALVVALNGCGTKELRKTEEPKAEKQPAITEAAEEEAVPTPEAQEEVEEPAEETVSVVGNGEFFIQVGNRVYFRQYDEKALSNSALWGDFYSAAPENGSAQICYLEDGHGRAEVAFADQGYGPLYFYKDRFYLKDSTSCYSVKEDGSDRQRVSLDRNNLADFFVNGKYLYYTELNGDTDAVKVKDLDTDKDTTVFQMPQSDLGYPQLSQAEVVDGQVYLGVWYVAGSAAIYQGGEIYRAPLDGSNPKGELLKTVGVNEESEEDSIWEMRTFSVNSDGTVKIYDHKPNSAWVLDGDLYISNGNGIASCKNRGFLEDTTGFFSKRVEQVCQLEGNIYAIVNTVRRSAEYDIGWREAYKLVESDFCYMDSANADVHMISEVSVNNRVIPAYVWLLPDEEGVTKVLYNPMVTVSPEDTQLCDYFMLDPADPKQFENGYELVSPYYDQGYVCAVSDQLKYSYKEEDSTQKLQGGKDEFKAYMVEDTATIFRMVTLQNLTYTDYMDCYSLPVTDYDADVFYKNILANVTFNEDGSEILAIDMLN